MKSLVLSAAMLLASSGAFACSNLIVGKKASVDGSVMVSYNADDYGMFGHLCHYPAGTHPKGTMRQIYDWDSGVYHGEIEEAPVTYNVIGNINEFQLSIGETTYGGREEMVDSTGILDYGSLIYVTLQRAKTAREAISVMTSLVEKYGYNSEGETFSICDPNEAWIMEMQGTGAGSKGVVWVAMRIPDDAICAHANQSRIGKFNMKDKKNVLYSKNVISYARKMGWFNGKDSDFSWKNTYAFPDFSGRRFCDARVWSFFNHYADDFDRYLPWALGKDKDAEDMPLWIVPNRKLSVADVENGMRDHYEGTALALDTTSIGGGIYEMPYRPTPLTFTVDGKQYFNERPISTQQTAFTFVSQLRSWLPREIGGVLWFGNDDANMVAYTPVYCGNTVQPACYNTKGADAVTFSSDNAFWLCNMVSNMVYPRYSQLFPELKAVRDSLETSYFANQTSIEKQAADLYQTDKAAALKLLNNYSNTKADEMLASWKHLATRIIVKYNDMAVKKEKDGKLLQSVTRPGYPASFGRKLVKETGDWYAVPVEKK
ncbi:MAG: C69 family dipeptidase [Prevotella stercorea]|uniref:C69 family dipeptidase n=1 Tax=Leyella stercorea TaxID=363265 RepID=UPI0025F6D6BC|nr:C69 family dipeptidase [Prevotella sp.]MDD6940855.1 C69 family dipeptidase [Leyella stercorea]MCI6898618.1 C69 family dipeptidase [Prevotella sp.]MCI7475724.1 C69 family dipeptidase [Prevotella sp.]MDD7211913.1 C69 family dipeptidase [Leyella stercorea]